MICNPECWEFYNNKATPDVMVNTALYPGGSFAFTSGLPAFRFRHKKNTKQNGNQFLLK